MLFLLLRHLRYNLNPVPWEARSHTLNHGRHDLRSWATGSMTSDAGPWEAQPQMLDRGSLRPDTASVPPSSAEGSAPPTNKQPGD